MSTPTQPSYKALAAQYINIVETFKFKMHHIYNSHGKKETLNSLLQQNPEIWGKALSNEWGWLAQGNDYGIIGTDTIEFILKSEVPHGRDVTYASFVCDKRPLKTEPFRVRIVVGGDRLSFDDDTGSPATDLLETKVLLNSTISDSDQGARFLSADLKDYFLGSPMSRSEYMKVHISKFTPDIIQKYNLNNKADNNG